MIVSFQNVYAIDYVDSTGYTPSWAYSLGQYQTLAKCLAIIEIDSPDGNWCFEWAAYTLDNYEDSQSNNNEELKVDESLKSYLPSVDKLQDSWIATGFIDYGFFRQDSLKQFNIISELSRGYQLEDKSFKVVVTVGRTDSIQTTKIFLEKLSNGIKEKLPANSNWIDDNCFGFIDPNMNSKSLQFCINNEYIFQISVIGNKKTSEHKIISNEFSNIINMKFESKIPEWVKNTMQWYLDGLISEDEMIKAIQFLVKENIIKI